MQEGANFMLLADVRFELCSIKHCNKGKVLHLQLPSVVGSAGHGWFECFCDVCGPFFMQPSAPTTNLLLIVKSGPQSK